jgi:hypothetical protein
VIEKVDSESTIQTNKRSLRHIQLLEPAKAVQSVELGPHGFPVEHTEEGAKIEWVPDDEQDDGFRPESVPRNDEEVGAAIDELCDRIWYCACYQAIKAELARGEMKIVESSTDKDYDHVTTIVRESWEGVKRGAKRIENEYGKRNLLGPYSDFEWGMIKGKLSALRWTGGAEWDWLDI